MVHKFNTNTTELKNEESKDKVTVYFNIEILGL